MNGDAQELVVACTCRGMLGLTTELYRVTSRGLVASNCRGCPLGRDGGRIHTHHVAVGDALGVLSRTAPFAATGAGTGWNAECGLDRAGRCAMSRPSQRLFHQPHSTRHLRSHDGIASP